MADWVQGRVIDNVRWNETHYSILIDAPIGPFHAGQFVRIGLDLGDERIGRPYSCVNAPHEHPIEIFFNVVPEGPLSGRLAALKAGDEVWVMPKANGLLTLESVPVSARHLWMMATGTGVGPFLSMLRTRQAWEGFARIVLAYGVRHLADFAYREVIAELQANHPEQLVFVPLVTREDAPHALKGRIPGAIASGQLEDRAGIGLTPQHSHVMLCGNSGMIADASKLLEARGLRRHHRNNPGHYSLEKYH